VKTPKIVNTSNLAWLVGDTFLKKIIFVVLAIENHEFSKERNYNLSTSHVITTSFHCGSSLGH